MSETIRLVQVSKPNKQYFVFALETDTETTCGVDNLVYSFNTSKGLRKLITNYADTYTHCDYWQIFDSKTGYAVTCYGGIEHLRDMLKALENETSKNNVL